MTAESHLYYSVQLLKHILFVRFCTSQQKDLVPSAFCPSDTVAMVTLCNSFSSKDNKMEVNRTTNFPCSTQCCALKQNRHVAWVSLPSGQSKDCLFLIDFFLSLFVVSDLVQFCAFAHCYN